MTDTPQRNRNARLHEQAYVTSQRKPSRIEKIESHPLIEWNVSAFQELPKTGDPRLCFLPPQLPSSTLGCLIDRKWPRAYERHVATQNVDQLRYLIEPSFA
jgi:hypothetical protein